MPTYTRAGSEFGVNQVTNLNQTGVRVASLPGNRYIVVWSSDANSPNEADIVGRIYNSDGTPAGPEFAVNSQIIGHQATPDVVALANGSFVVTWVDYNSTQDGDSTCIKAQLFDANGAPIGTEFLVNVSGTGRQDSAEVAALSNGGFVVSWDDWPSTDMYGRIYGADGLPASGAIRMNSNTTGRQELGEIVGLGNGNFLAMWRTTDTTADGSGDAIKAQIFDSNGNMVGTEFRINMQTVGSQNAPAVTLLSNGNFIVSWTTSDATADGSVSAIKAQIFTATGVPVGTEFLVNSQGVNAQNSSSITALADGGFFITWATSDTAQDGSMGAIKGRFFDANGVAGGAEILINSVALGSQSLPSVAANADGSVMVTWVTSVDGFTDRNIRGQIFRANVAPVITSDGGAEKASIAADENQVVVTTVTASDMFGPQSLAYSIIGGSDAGLFVIDAATGVIQFAAAQDFEAPADSNGDNVYDVIVSVSDGELTDTQALSISLGNINEAVEIPAAGTFTISENQQTVGSVQAVDPDGAAINYSIAGGVDAALFGINSTTGELTFLSAPNFETPGDVGGDNVYDILVEASDGVTSAVQTVTVNVTDVNEAPSFTSFGGGATVTTTVAENSLFAGVPSAVDPEGSYVYYAIAGGADAGRFSLNPGSNAITFLQLPNFEAAGDADGDNVYELVLSATDLTGNSSLQTVYIQITDVNEAPIFTSHGGGFIVNLAIDEGSTAVTTATATDAEGQAVTYSIWGGTDAARFSVDAVTGLLTFIGAPDFETPTDADGNNVYSVAVAATDGVNLRIQNFNISIGNVNEAPVITSNGGGDVAAVTVSENQLAVTTVTSSDPDGQLSNYSIVGGADAALFQIDAATGVLSFVAGPNYEVPSDAGSNNIYDVVVQASDGNLVDTQNLAITVTNVNEAPVITSNGGGASASIVINENTSSVTTITSTDPEGALRTYSIVGGADAARFTVNASTGALSFVSAPNYEAPADAGGNNIYDVIVQVSDGAVSTTQNLAVSVNNVVDGSTINGTNSANTLNGTVAEDVIDGRNGNDTISGGLGADRLIGGSGADRFVYGATNHSNAANMDIIQDFSRSQGDRISLSAIDANGNLAGDQAFTFIGSAAFGNVAGQLRYAQVNGNTFVEGDVNGDGIADLVIQLTGNVNLLGSDFIL